MDRVRFGRALGYGARHAAKSMLAAAEAATAPDPAQPGAAAAETPRRPQIIPPANARRLAQDVTQTVTAVRQGASSARAASESVAAPLRRFSAVLWLEITGTFFALLAFSFGSAAWHFRAGFAAGAHADLRNHAWAFAAMFLLFGYFSLSSFLRAGRRGRR